MQYLRHLFNRQFEGILFKLIVLPIAHIRMVSCIGTVSDYLSYGIALLYRPEQLLLV